MVGTIKVILGICPLEDDSKTVLVTPTEQKTMSGLARYEEPSAVKQWLDKVTGGSSGTGIMEHLDNHAEEVALTLRQFGEGGVVGVVLGALHGNLATGLDVHGVPVDGAAAVIGAVGAVFYANEEFSHDLRNLGSSALTVLAFRKTNELLHAKGVQAAASTAHGEESDVGADDPITEAARNL
jgi:hypothetical protein